jgi:Transposase and inactivated derivatives
MRRFELTDEQWEKIKHLLPGKEGDSGRTAQDNRLFVDAVLWTARTGAQWRDLPARFGNWNSIYQRFNRWAKAGRWQAIFEQMQDPDLEWLLIDSTIVRAHQHAAGALKKRETKRWDALAAAWEPRSTLPAKGLDCQYASC